MLFKTDLHIHSTLSACCDRENTLNNIINMSKVLGLRIIAIADHNSAKNVEVAVNLAKENGILCVPALEVTTNEEIHALCLFRNVIDAKILSDEIASSSLKYPLNEKIYYPQTVLDKNDCVIEKIDYLLNVATNFDIYSLINRVRQLDGIVIPAHIDKESASLYSVFGVIPNDIDLTTVECRKCCPTAVLNDCKDKYNVIYSSDAHNLGSMCENDFYLDLKEMTIDSLFDYLLKR